MSCITGDETGLVKVWDISHSSGGVLKYTQGEQKRSNGITAMCWLDELENNTVLYNTKDGYFHTMHVNTTSENNFSWVSDSVAACSSGLKVVRGKCILVTKMGDICINNLVDCKESVTINSIKNLDTSAFSSSSNIIRSGGDIHCVDIHQRYNLVALAGKETDLKVWDISQGYEKPFFEAQNVEDHILGVPYDIYVTGCCIIQPHVYGVCTAFHDVRFYDARVSHRPVSQYKIEREIERRPTCMLQWNDNKFLISEASGDIHLYDTRRGFKSRAKFKGGTGSVRCMVKHPSGCQLIGAVGLDRKARIYHVSTGKLLQSIYLKQRGQAFLFNKDLPFKDNLQLYYNTNNLNFKAQNSSKLEDSVWNTMNPVIDNMDSKVSEVTCITSNDKPSIKNVSSVKKFKKKFSRK